MANKKTAEAWTNKETQLLRDYFEKGLSSKEVAVKLKRTEFAVRSKKLSLGIITRNYNNWSKKEEEILKKFANKYTATQLNKKFLPNQSVYSIYRMRNKLGLQSTIQPTVWTKEEEKIFFKNASSMKNEDLAKLLPNKSSKLIYRKRMKEGIKAPNSKKIYTKKNLEIIKKNLHLEDKQIAKILNETEDYVIRFRKKERLMKRSAHRPFPKYFNIWYDKKLNRGEKLETFSFHLGNTNEITLRCPDNSEHIFPKKIKLLVMAYKTSGKIGCPYCKNLLVHPNDSFAARFPILSRSFSNKNIKKSKEIHYGARKKYFFECKNNHTEKLMLSALTLKGRTNDLKIDREYECPTCNSNYLINLRPDLYKELSKEKNTGINLETLSVHSARVVWWVCEKNSKHEWQLSPEQRQRPKVKRCPFCDKNHWSKTYLKLFLKSIVPMLPSMTQSERWVFFQQSGILDSTKRNVAFAKQLATQKFPIKEIEKFINNEASLVDDILDDPSLTSEDYVDTKTDVEIEKEIDDAVQKFDESIEQTDEKFPEIKSKDVLKSLDQITSSQFCDKEAIEFLIISKKEKLWRDVFERGKVAVNEIKKATGNEYVKRAQSEFLFEYSHTAKLKSPKNFTARTNDGNLIKPNLMQFLTTTRLDYNSRIGNWSGTGAGKTLSAILASRLLDMKFTIVTCPNSVVTNWQDNIRDAFKDSEILDKSKLPDKINPKKHSYLVLNYEYFQQPTSSSYVKKLLSLGKISFIVIDEVHYTKQREVDNVSKRKEMIKNLVVEAGKKNKNLKVIGMSATPVINNLFEGRSMIELITGKEHKDIDTNVNVNNCMYLFQKLSTIGTRYLPKYQVGIVEDPRYIDCSDVVEEIREKGANRISVLDLELILTKKRIPEIIKHLEKKTLIYTHYIKGIGELLAEAISKEGYTVGFYTGEDKSGLKSFVKGNTDVLIGTSAIGTGVDGLQDVCRKLIFNVLPWTNAEYEQIKGRIFRQGQKQNVEFILPLTKAEVNGQEWSWCKTKLDRIHYKKTVADASVDGIIPEEHIRSEHQVLQDLMKWLDRLSDKGLEIIERKELASTLFTDDDKELRRRKINHGDFTKINTRWNGSRSVVTHKRLQKNKSEWVHYHEEYRKARKDWVMTPYKEMVKFYKKRDGLVIGDFGCGEGFIYKDLSSKHTVHSFDHVAMEEFVTECDFSKTPLDDETLDVAIYSLSMMGSNINEYLHEAHRVLKLDGKINIIEATSRFKDVKQFMNQLQDFGFDRVVSSDMWKFTHIVAEKSDRVIKKDTKIKF